MENTKLNPQIAAMKDAYLSGKTVPDRQIALASLSILDDYRWVPGPTPPREVIEFNAMDPKKKQVMRSKAEEHKAYWEDLVVKKYYDDRIMIKHLNERNESWLKWMKLVLPEHEVEINLKLHQFKDSYRESLGIEQPDWNDNRIPLLTRRMDGLS